MNQGETIHTGAPDTCADCGKKPELEVLRSNAGFYVGTQCDCGPYSRESDYYPTREAGEQALARIKIELGDFDLRQA